MEPYTQSIERLYLGTHEIDIGTHPANPHYLEITVRRGEDGTLETDEKEVSNSYIVIKIDALPVLVAALDKFKEGACSP